METTFLFVPAHEERKVARALAKDADAVILDLEASVPDASKDQARDAIEGYAIQTSVTRVPSVWIRVNPGGAPLLADLSAIDWTRVDGVVVPQAEDPLTLTDIQRVTGRRLIPLVETAKGFAVLPELAAVPGVERFAIGTWDLVLDLGLFAISDPDHSELIWQLRADLVLASRQLGLAPPIDGVYADLKGTDLQAVCERAHLLGYAGKLLIHPQQLPTAHAVFGLNEERLRHAKRVLDAYETAVARGAGVITVDGMMVDYPMAARARALLSLWSGAAPS